MLQKLFLLQCFSHNIFKIVKQKKRGGGELEFGMYFNVLVWNLVTFLDETVDVPFGVLKTLCWPR